MKQVGVTCLQGMNESVIIAGYGDGNIRVWDLKKGVILREVNFYENENSSPYSKNQRNIVNIVKVN